MVRGDVHAVTLPRRGGHAHRGRRYAVVVQADDLLGLSTVIVCPTSSTRAASFHPEVTVAGEHTRVLCEMAGAVDAGRLGDHVDHLARDELLAVDDALALVLGLR